MIGLDRGWRTDRLSLEPLTVAHATELAPLLDDHSLHEFTGGAPLSAAALAARYARLAARRSPGGDQLWGNWVLRVRVTDEVAGTVQAALPAGGPAAGLTGVDGDPDGLREQLCWPVDGALFDVERNALWHPSWGPRPAGTSHALDTARQYLARAPKMIPVYAHRYLPAGRGTCGHPVLSIVQTDIIVYGTDLAEYINHEFTDPGRCISPDWGPPPMVPFWSEFL